jgi:hypothetical protein
MTAIEPDVIAPVPPELALPIGTTYKVVLSTPVGSTLPRDYEMVTPHFKDIAATLSAAAAATAWAGAFAAWLGTGVEIRCTIYRADLPFSGPPVAAATAGSVGSSLHPPVPQEIALCLSYYATSNIKRSRGRLYLPASWLLKHLSTVTVDNRPDGATRNAALTFAASVLTANEASGWQWHLHSKADSAFKRVTNVYVDDEWDTQRRRGQKPTTRSSATYP